MVYLNLALALRLLAGPSREGKAGPVHTDGPDIQWLTLWTSEDDASSLASAGGGAHDETATQQRRGRGSSRGRYPGGLPPGSAMAASRLLLSVFTAANGPQPLRSVL